MAKPKENPELAKKLVESIKGAETGTGTSEGDVFNDNLPEGHTKESANELFGYLTTFVAAGQDAAGQVALKAMEANADLKQVDVHIPMGGYGYGDYNVRQSAEVNVPPKEAGGASTKKTSYGLTTPAITFVGAQSKSGLLGAARTAIKANFTEKFGK